MTAVPYCGVGYGVFHTIHIGRVLANVQVSGWKRSCLGVGIHGQASTLHKVQVPGTAKSEKLWHLGEYPVSRTRQPPLGRNHR